MDKDLFDKYFDGLCNASERYEVEQWLQDANPNELDKFMLEIWDADHPSMPKQQEVILQNKLKSIYGFAPKMSVILDNRFRRRLKYCAAACIGLLLLLTPFFIKKQSLSNQISQVKELPAQRKKLAEDVWAYVKNDQKTIKNIDLEDGSTVLLYEKSSLRYLKTFGPNQRLVYLEGTAEFKVFKDKSRPFTVFSNDINTTALGTRFLVSTLDENRGVTVKLYSGKVVIKASQNLDNWKKDIVLSPGSQLRYYANIPAIVSRFVPSPGKTIGSALPAIDKLSRDKVRFNNASLPDVMHYLSGWYKRKITFRHTDINKMNFTGTIMRTDSLQSVLNIISKMNSLDVTEMQAGYSISLSLQ